MGFKKSLEVQRDVENRRVGVVSLEEYERVLNIDDLMNEIVNVVKMETYNRMWSAHWFRIDAFPGNLAQYVLELKLRAESDPKMGFMDWGEVENIDSRVKELGLMEVEGQEAKEDDRIYKIVVDVAFDDEGQRWVIYLFDQTEEETGKPAFEYQSFEVIQEAGREALADGLARLYRLRLEPLLKDINY